MVRSVRVGAPSGHARGRRPSCVPVDRSTPYGAAFCPASNGLPVAAFDPQTGDVHAEVARTWEKFDLRLLLDRSWDELGPKLAGKLHIHAGAADDRRLR